MLVVAFRLNPEDSMEEAEDEDESEDVNEGDEIEKYEENHTADWERQDCETARAIAVPMHRFRWILGVRIEMLSSIPVVAQMTPTVGSMSKQQQK